MDGKDEAVIRWRVQVPHRWRRGAVQLALSGPATEELTPMLRSSRYDDGISTYTLPLTQITTGAPGYGEQRNPVHRGRYEPVYYTASLPAGGRFYLYLHLPKTKLRRLKISAWATGYEASARRALIRRAAPPGLAKYLPYQHPLGFPVAIELPLPT